MTIAMLSLAGFPATVGFIGKFYLIDASVAGDYAWLGVTIVIGSVISLAYYLRVVAVMWMGSLRGRAARPAGAARQAGHRLVARGGRARAAGGGAGGGAVRRRHAVLRDLARPAVRPRARRGHVAVEPALTSAASFACRRAAWTCREPPPGHAAPPAALSSSSGSVLWKRPVRRRLEPRVGAAPKHRPAPVADPAQHVGAAVRVVREERPQHGDHPRGHLAAAARSRPDGVAVGRGRAAAEVHRQRHQPDRKDERHQQDEPGRGPSRPRDRPITAAAGGWRRGLRWLVVRGSGSDVRLRAGSAPPPALRRARSGG